MKTINKLNFKGKTLYRKTVTENILNIYNDNRFNFSSLWYLDANMFSRNLGKEFNISHLKVAGIIAALSPLKSWDENKRIAKSFLQSGNSYHTTVMTNKAIAIRDYKGTECSCKEQEAPNLSEFIINTLRGNKIQSFYINIAFPYDDYAVTIDRHAIAICLGRNTINNEQSITDNQYDFFVSCYVDVAKSLGLVPNLVQSITWEKWREIKKL